MKIFVIDMVSEYRYTRAVITRSHAWARMTQLGWSQRGAANHLRITQTHRCLVLCGRAKFVIPVKMDHVTPAHPLDPSGLALGEADQKRVVNSSRKRRPESETPQVPAPHARMIRIGNRGYEGLTPGHRRGSSRLQNHRPIKRLRRANKLLYIRGECTLS